MAKGFPAAFVTLVVGLIAIGISYKQYKTAKAKLKLDLFEKRYSVFESAWRFLSESTNVNNTAPFAPDFTNMTPQAGFLFGPEVEKYLKDIWEKRAQLKAIFVEQSSRSLTNEEISRKNELLNWFFEQASGEAKRVFSPWLEFSEWK